MAINFDKALGIHPQALAMREKRSEVLAANLANADTPGYKARDLDFKSILKQNLPEARTLERTQAGHFAPQQLLESRADVPQSQPGFTGWEHRRSQCRTSQVRRKCGAVSGQFAVYQ